MRKLKEKMRTSKLLKKAEDLGITDGLGIVPLTEVLLPRTAIGQVAREGSHEKEEGIEIDEDVPTQPPPTAAVLVPATNAPIPPLIDTTIGQLGIQGFRSSTEEVINSNLK